MNDRRLKERREEARADRQEISVSVRCSGKNLFQRKDVNRLTKSHFDFRLLDTLDHFQWR